MLQKFPLDKINVTKIAPLFPSRAPTNGLLYKLKYIVHLSKTVCGISILIPSRFYQTLYFCSTKSMNSLTLHRLNSYQKKNDRKATHSFAPRSDF